MPPPCVGVAFGSRYREPECRQQLTHMISRPRIHTSLRRLACGARAGSLCLEFFRPGTACGPSANLDSSRRPLRVQLSKFPRCPAPIDPVDMPAEHLGGYSRQETRAAGVRVVSKLIAVAASCRGAMFRSATNDEILCIHLAREIRVPPTLELLGYYPQLRRALSLPRGR
jgi:hypothetical protein